MGGTKATVRSIIVDPSQDPHSYEPSAQDARTLATAQLAIVNGVGYDPWAPKLIAANPTPGRAVLTVGDLFGLKEGDNPHRWYDPAEVTAVANAIASDLKRLDPKDAAYFDQRLQTFETTDLGQYHQLIAQIRSRYAGVPVGASESIFALQAPALGLEPPNPVQLHEGDQRGHGRERAGHAHHAAADHRPPDQGVDLQLAEHHARDPATQRARARERTSRSSRSPRRSTPRTTASSSGRSASSERIAQALHQATGR